MITYPPLEARVSALEHVQAYTHARIEEAYQEMTTSVKHLSEEMEDSFKIWSDYQGKIEDHIDERFAEVNTRFSEVNTRFAEVNTRFSEVNARLDKVDARLDKMEARLDKVEARLDKIETLLVEILTRLPEKTQ